MQQSNTIQFLHNHQIDKKQWDECVLASANSLIYAQSFYLDNMAAGWNALVGENYDWVLPLVHRKKFGIEYLFQPAFTQQLGIFAKNGVDVPFATIITDLQKWYRFWEINWNYGSPVQMVQLPVQFKPATNFVIHLEAGYQAISESYHKDLIKNLKRSKQFKLHYQSSKEVEKLVSIYRKYYQKRMPHVTAADYHNFSKVCADANEARMLLCREVVDDAGELLAASIILNDGKRMYNMMNTITAGGRKVEANHFLLDKIIKEFAGQSLMFDFEGSDLPGVKSFYENFGGTNQPYFSLKFNNLPWFVKWFKQ